MRGWALLLLCTFSSKPRYDIHPRYLYDVYDFVKRCGDLCEHPQRAQLKMQPVTQLEMYSRTGDIGNIGVAITTWFLGFQLKREIYVLEKLTGYTEKAVIVHELFHSLATFSHVESDEFSFMTPDSRSEAFYRDNWEALWKADLCRLAQERGYFEHEACI